MHGSVDIQPLHRPAQTLLQAVSQDTPESKASIPYCQDEEAMLQEIGFLRTDFHWKLAGRLVSEYDTICLETLNTKAMQQMWGRKISDLAFSDFVKILSAMSAKYGKTLVKINQWEATSKTCSNCFHKEKEMPLDVRKWTCPECGAIHDRDINAARNILRVGTSTLGRGSVRPTP